jgi:hypothetical protein
LQGNGVVGELARNNPNNRVALAEKYVFGEEHIK